MPSDSFQFKQFTIRQDRCAMKVGTDGVLLGAWAHIPESLTDGQVARVADIGSGTGIISLMVAQRLSERLLPFCIDAIEIDVNAANQAQENVSASPWSESINVHPRSLESYCLEMDSAHEEEEAAHRYDLIISNPPFYNATLKPEDQGRAIARHKDSLPVAEIAAFASRQLKVGGRLALIYPTDYDSEVMTAAVLNGLSPVRICDVLTKIGKPCKRRMAEFMAHSEGIERTELAIRDAEGHYTEEYKLLTGDFYLKLTE